MKTTDPLAYSPAERRRVLANARASGELCLDDLDRVLIHSAQTEMRLRTLVRSLDGVFITSSRSPDDVLSQAPLVETAEELAAGGDDLRRYADLVRTLPRLTRGQEHLMARRLDFARERLRQFLAHIEMPEDTRTQMLERGLNCGAVRRQLSQAGDEVDVDAILRALPCGSRDPYATHVVGLYDDLRARIVERNLYLVIGMASAYRTYGVPMMDLVQEGNASLIRAVEKFDWHKNVRFGTYAAFWVRQAVERLITANRGIVRVPNYIQQKMRRLRREGKLPRNARDMDVRDVSQLFGTDLPAAARLVETDRGWFSLDLPMGKDDGTYAQTLAAEDSGDDITEGEQQGLAERLDEVMGETLTDVERDILVQRFGLGGSRPRTLDEIGAELNVSRERIRQMQVKALQKLQRQGAREPLADYL